LWTTLPIARRRPQYWRTWKCFVRGDIHELKAPRNARGHEQAGSRYAVVVQSDDLPLSTLLVAPTSMSARDTSFRPVIAIGSESTRVLVEQVAAVDPERLGRLVGHVGRSELAAIDDALRLVLELD
jgi:mRNA interferase MazF